MTQNNDTPIIFKKRPNDHRIKLIDIAPKQGHFGLIFADIHHDLGEAIHQIMANTAEIKMAYGHARLIAMAALYIQGLVERDKYDHVLSIFEGLKYQMGQNAGFQQQALYDAVEFIRTYSPAMNALVAQKILEIATEYEIPKGRLDDAQLIGIVIDTIHAEEKTSLTPAKPEQITNVFFDEEPEFESLPLAEIIEVHGFEAAVEIVAELVLERIPNRQIAYEFTMEELDGASQGNTYAQGYAFCSGIDENEYIGALKNSNPYVDGPEGPQQLLLKFCLELLDDPWSMAKFRCDVGNKIMEHFSLGVYSREYSSNLLTGILQGKKTP